MNNEFRELLVQSVAERVPESVDRAAVLLSGGIDSLTCAFALNKIGLNVTGYTFFVEGRGSEDVRAARKAADLFEWRHTVIEVPTENLEEDFLLLASSYDCDVKTEFENTWPFLYVYPEMEEEVVVSGIAADGHYGVSRKAMMHYRDDLETLNQFRSRYFSGDNPAGIRQQRELSRRYEKKLVPPYLDERVKDYWMQFTWEEINEPRQKQKVMQAFPDRFHRFGWRPHKNLQLEAGVDVVFESLLDSPLNKNNRNRVMDLGHDFGKFNNLDPKRWLNNRTP
jgi:asparagine synthetase B (glutamine-hydrolysing)